MLALAGCTEPFDPFHGATAYSPPAWYRERWAMIEQCSGKQGDFSAVRWFATERMRSVTVIATSDYEIQAVAIRPAYVDSVLIVSHEMGHLLIKEPGHPLWFAEKCGQLVSDW